MKFFKFILTSKQLFLIGWMMWTVLDAHAQWSEIQLSQADPRFEIRGRRNYSSLGDWEEYEFTVYNKTSDNYRLTIRIEMDLVCNARKNFILNGSEGLFVKGGNSWDSDRTSGLYIAHSMSDENDKKCRIKDHYDPKPNNEFTYLSGIRYTIIKAENITQKEAAEAKKKADDDAKIKAAADAKKKADDDAKIKAAADAKKKADDDAKTKTAADAKKKADDDAKQQVNGGKSNENGKSASKDTQTKKESDKTKKESDSESAKSAPIDNGPSEEEKAEAARQAAIKEEEDRKKRVQEWKDKKNAETSENQDMATQFLIQAALVYYGLGNLMYSGFEPLGVLEEYTGMSSRLKMNFGYEISATPMYSNSIKESYNGITTTYDRKSEDHDSYNFNLGAGIEYWPLYHKNFGLGMHAGGSLGHGFTLEDFSLTYQFGLKTHWHPGKLGMVAEYTQGGREIDHNPWIESTESGGGNIAYTYQRLAMGPSYRFETDWDGKSESRFDLMAIFEIPSFSKPSSLDPAVMNWQNGFRANLSFSNRLDIFFEYFPSYQRDGVRNYSLSLSSTSFAGSMFRFGVHRNFDFFGEGGNNSGETHYQINRSIKNRSVLYVVSPGISWLQNTPGKRFGNFYRFNLMPIAFEQEFYLNHHLALYAGVGLSIFEGGELQGYSNSPFGADNLVNMESFNMNIPIGLRLRSALKESHFWWLKVGLGNSLPLYQALYLDGKSEPADEVAIKARTNGETLPKYFNSTQISIGADFATGSNIMRCGLEYSVSNQDLLHSLGIGRIQGLRLCIGITL